MQAWYLTKESLQFRLPPGTPLWKVKVPAFPDELCRVMSFAAQMRGIRRSNALAAARHDRYVCERFGADQRKIGGGKGLGGNQYFERALAAGYTSIDPPVELPGCESQDAAPVRVVFDGGEFHLLEFIGTMIAPDPLLDLSTEHTFGVRLGCAGAADFRYLEVTTGRRCETNGAVDRSWRGAYW
jgi:hypothetical protein